MQYSALDLQYFNPFSEINAVSLVYIIENGIIWFYFRLPDANLLRENKMFQAGQKKK